MTRKIQLSVSQSNPWGLTADPCFCSLLGTGREQRHGLPLNYPYMNFLGKLSFLSQDWCQQSNNNHKQGAKKKQKEGLLLTIPNPAGVSATSAAGWKVQQAERETVEVMAESRQDSVGRFHEGLCALHTHIHNDGTGLLRAAPGRRVGSQTGKGHIVAKGYLWEFQQIGSLFTETFWQVCERKGGCRLHANPLLLG